MVPGVAAHFAEAIEAGIGHDAGADGVLSVAAFRARRWHQRTRSHEGERKRSTDELKLQATEGERNRVRLEGESLPWADSGDAVDRITLRGV